MLRKNASQWLLAFLAALCLVPGAAPRVLGDEHVLPFIEPSYFDPDFQFFAPADVEPYGDCPEPNIGWFFTYDRAFMNVTRPATQSRPWEGDFTWGNRYEAGYMSHDDKGWLLTVWHVDGASYSEPQPQQSGEADLTSVELNKTWRRRFHNGAVFEVLVGGKYAKITDEFFDTNVNQELDPNDPDLVGDLDLRSFVENNMFGGQIGCRVAKQKGHWVLSTDFRVMGAVNFQYFDAEFTFTDDAAPPDNGSFYDVQFQNVNQFVVSGELRFDAEYIVTRDVSLHMGVQLLHYGRGVGRSTFRDTDIVNGLVPPPLYEDDQDFTAAGFTFGVAINR